MKKLFSALFIVMMIAFACTMIASAAEVYTPDADGLYNIEYAVTADDGTQFGMVVIEATGDEAFALDEATIRYIDQVGAEDNAIAFDAFIPMDLKNAGTYKVYIGGGALDEATFIGTLGEAAEEPGGGDEPVVPSEAIDGDVDYNGVYNTADALYLVNHLALGDFGLYPVTYPKSLDFDSSGVVNTADALYLVNNLALGDFGMYPLYPQN